MALVERQRCVLEAPSNSQNSVLVYARAEGSQMAGSGKVALVFESCSLLLVMPCLRYAYPPDERRVEFGWEKRRPVVLTVHSTDRVPAVTPTHAPGSHPEQLVKRRESEQFFRLEVAPDDCCECCGPPLWYVLDWLEVDAWP